MREPDVPAQPVDVPSDVEHELMNSLAAILGFGQVIHRNAALPEDLRYSAQLLVHEATRTRDLVRVLLDRVREPPPMSRTPIRETAGGHAVRGADSATGTSATPSTTATTGRPRILVLDDEPTFRVFLEKALTLLGYEPLITSHSAEALERASDGDLAALLFDHQLPGVSGVEAFEALVAARPDLAPRLVLMSGDVLDPALEAFATKHAVMLLAKPFDLATLDGTIRAVMTATGQLRG